MIVVPVKLSLQARLCEFEIIFIKGIYVAKLAFSKQQIFVSLEFIHHLYDKRRGVDINGGLQTFKGMHLIAVDGTRVACENTPELIAEFGYSGPKKDACTALVSVAYDIIEQVSYDC